MCTIILHPANALTFLLGSVTMCSNSRRQHDPLDPSWDHGGIVVGPDMAPQLRALHALNRKSGCIRSINGVEHTKMIQATFSLLIDETFTECTTLLPEK